ncbi:MAG: 2Fe-2S iron-sulfur cluster-binding protein [Sphingomonadales bacterium]
MTKIYVTDRDGERHEVEAEADRSIMEITRDAGLPIQAICGGNCICTTCHAYIDKDWYEKLDKPSEDEMALLEDSGSYKPTSRLLCQVPYTDELGGISMKLAPEF